MLCGESGYIGREGYQASVQVLRRDVQKVLCGCAMSKWNLMLLLKRMHMAKYATLRVQVVNLA